MEEAKVIIAKLHPLATTPFEKVFPTIGCFFKCCGCCYNSRKARMTEIKRLVKEERAKQDKMIDDIFQKYNIVFEGKGPDAYSHSNDQSEIDDEEYDPYNQLGYGWGAYFKTLTVFGWVFLLLSVLMLPAFYYFSAAGGLKQVTHGYYNSIFMLGNLGFNKAVCVSQYV